jgi:hypothetical protein
MNLANLETEILTLHNGLTFRPTLETMQRIGELLTDAKRRVPHGGWLSWVRKIGLQPRIAQVYVQVSKAQQVSHLPEYVTVNGFLGVIQAAKSAGRAAEMEERRQAAIRANPPIASNYQVHHHDCRTFRSSRCGGKSGEIVGSIAEKISLCFLASKINPSRSHLPSRWMGMSMSFHLAKV